MRFKGTSAGDWSYLPGRLRRLGIDRCVYGYRVLINAPLFRTARPIVRWERELLGLRVFHFDAADGNVSSFNAKRTGAFYVLSSIVTSSVTGYKKIVNKLDEEFFLVKKIVRCRNDDSEFGYLLMKIVILTRD